jgi:hypothetical protein
MLSMSFRRRRAAIVSADFDAAAVTPLLMPL